MPQPNKSRSSILQTVAILEVMWDWNSMTSDAGYTEIAPRWFSINPDNKTGSVLYELLGHGSLLVTNACPELVSSASGRGTPDKDWLRENLTRLYNQFKFQQLLVCGKVAKQTFERYWLLPSPDVQVIWMPHPAARSWTEEGLAHAQSVIQSPNRNDIELSLDYNPTRGCSKGILFA